MEKFEFTSIIRVTNCKTLSILSIAFTIHSCAVALSGGPAGLKLCGAGSRPKPLNLR